jgi:predicted CXXCH cytochrome family protein
MNQIRRFFQCGFPPVQIVLMLFLCAFCIGMTALSGQVWAAGLELLTPQSGDTVIARNPLTHIVLRQPATGQARQVRVEKTGALLDPIVSMDDGESAFLHFRVPLVPGMNTFIIVPGDQKVELNYKRVQAEINPKSFDKNVLLFHVGNKLPKSCQACHDLDETETIDPGGLKKQTSCAACHKNITEKGSWKHSTTVTLQCLSCHQQSSKPWRIGVPPEKIQELCFNCHTGKRGWSARKVVHGPLYLGGCTLCHDPHGENHRYQLWAEGSLTLCVSCHSGMENLVSEVNRLPYVHGIIPGKGCIACHDPHATDEKFMLRKPINELCLGCHQDLPGGLQGHPVAGHPLSAPMEFRRPGRQLTCVGCHDPHGSYYKSLLVETKMGARLCHGCHDRK